jgi:hypothetical protein
MAPTRNPSRSKATITCIAVVDLPVPPFSLPNTITVALRAPFTGDLGSDTSGDAVVVISSTTEGTLCRPHQHDQAGLIQIAVS